MRVVGCIARLVGPGLPHHVTQRRNHRMDTFFGDDDNRAYLQLLVEWCGRHETRIWAYSERFFGTICGWKSGAIAPLPARPVRGECPPEGWAAEAMVGELTA